MKITALTAGVAVLGVFSGCIYQARLLDGLDPPGGSKVAIYCEMNDRPKVYISECGDFVFWATGPGPISAGAGYWINKSNNKKHWENLKSVLDRDCYAERFKERLIDVLIENRFIVERIQTRTKKDIKLAWLTLPKFGTGYKQEYGVDYILKLEIAYGLYGSDGQCSARIKGQMVRACDKKVVWKNKLRFDGRASVRHKPFGDGKPAVREWQSNGELLALYLKEAIDGSAALLGRELAGGYLENINEPLVKIRLMSGRDIKGKIVEETNQRVVIRLKGGSLRSIPATEFVEIVE